MVLKIVLRCFLVLVVDLLLLPIILCSLIVYILTCLEKFYINFVYNKDGKLELLNQKDALFMDDDEQLHYFFTAFFVVRGKMDVTKLRSMASAMLDGKDKNGKPVTDKFKKHVVRIGDFFFWERDDDFRIEDHVQEFPDRVLKSERDIKTLINEISKKRILEKGKSQWKMNLYPYRESGQQEEKFVLVFPCHHSIMDGVHGACIIGEYFTEGVDQSTLINLLSKLNSAPSWKIWLTKFLAAFYMPFMLFNSYVNEYTPLSVKGKDISGEPIITWSKPIDLTMVKRIKNKLRCSVNDVLLLCLSQSLRKAFIKNKFQLPKAFRVCQAATFADPSRLCEANNSLSFTSFNLPINCMSALDAMKHIRNQTNNYEFLLKCYVGYYISFLTFNTLPYKLLKTSMNTLGFSMITSNMPFSDSIKTFCGGILEDTMFTIPYRMQAGSVATFSSCGNEIRVVIKVEKNLVTPEVLENILDYFTAELQYLDSEKSIQKS